MAGFLPPFIRGLEEKPHGLLRVYRFQTRPTCERAYITLVRCMARSRLSRRSAKRDQRFAAADLEYGASYVRVRHQEDCGVPDILDRADPAGRKGLAHLPAQLLSG